MEQKGCYSPQEVAEMLVAHDIINSGATTSMERLRKYEGIVPKNIRDTYDVNKKRLEQKFFQSLH